MDGVVILKEVTETTILGHIALMLAMIVPVALCCGGITLCGNGRRLCSGWRKAAGATIIFFSLLSLLVYSAAVQNGLMDPIIDSLGLSSGTGKYEVRISGDIDMNEFYGHYDVLGCENGVYTVRLK